MAQPDSLQAINAMGLAPKRLRRNPAFVRWLHERRRIELDGRVLFLNRGDHLADEDQRLLEWTIVTKRLARQSPATPTSDDPFLDIEGEPNMSDNPASDVMPQGRRKGPELIKPGSGEESARRNPGGTSMILTGNGRESLFEQLRAGLKQVEVDGETLWVAEGDTLLSEVALKVYADERELRDRLRHAMEAASTAGIGMEPLLPSHGLAIMTQNGRIVRWKPGTVLTYRVARATFPDATYDAVVQGMNQATRDWEDTCGCDFRHRADLDDRPEAEGAAGAVFWVRYFDAGGAFLAAAFFPNDPRTRWHILIDPTFLNQNTFDPTGILRHELGHVLGFRHEHIRTGAPPACPDEPLSDVIALSAYDPKSVMHYFCGGVGSKTLAITESDKAASQKVYGQPFANLAFVDDEGL